MMNHKINDISKIPHEVTLTDEDWNGVQSIAENFGLSVSELLERIGHRQLVVMDSEEVEELLDTIDGLEALLEAKEEQNIPWEQAKVELGL